MPTTNVEFIKIGATSFSVPLPINKATSVVSQTFTPSSSNQQSAAAPLAFVRICTDTAIYVAFGSNPNAVTSTTARFMMPAGSVDYFEMTIGDKVAICTAP